ncbi:MAG: hypothetical protein KDI82_00115 [Gammaproteobacteria bacterium]|nr:hypothetical protein [Gammaproteobacteria bacterium]
MNPAVSHRTDCAPVSNIVALGIMVPTNSEQDFVSMRDELLCFVRSYRDEPGWVLGLA